MQVYLLLQIPSAIHGYVLPRDTYAEVRLFFSVWMEILSGIRYSGIGIVEGVR